MCGKAGNGVRFLNKREKVGFILDRKNMGGKNVRPNLKWRMRRRTK